MFILLNLLFVTQAQSAQPRHWLNIQVATDPAQPARGFLTARAILNQVELHQVEQPVLQVPGEGLFGAPSELKILATPAAIQNICHLLFDLTYSASHFETAPQAFNSLGFGVARFNETGKVWEYLNASHSSDPRPSVIRLVTCIKTQ